MEKLGKAKLVQRYAPKAAEQLKLLSRAVSRRSAAPGNLSSRLTTGAEEVAGAISGQPYKQMASRTEDVLSNIGEMIGRKMGGRASREAVYRYARKYGVPAEEAAKIMRTASPRELAGMADDIAAGAADPKSLVKSLRRPEAFSEAGRKAGRIVQNVEDFGRSVENVGVGVTGAGLKMAQHGGSAISKAGLAGKLAGTVAQPLEGRMMARYGSEELIRPKYQRSPWQSPFKRDKMYMAAK
jgi:hypothetical protein